MSQNKNVSKGSGMKIITLLIASMLSLTANAELITYEYSGIVIDSNNANYQSGQDVSGKMTISTDLSQQQEGSYIDTNTHSNFTFSSENSEFIITNTEENEFNYVTRDYMTGSDTTNVMFTAKKGWDNEITIELSQLPGVFNEIPNPLKPELATQIDLFVVQNGLYSSIEVTKMNQIKEVSCIEPTNFTSDLNVLNDFIETKIPVTWSISLTNNNTVKNWYAFWLSAKMPNGVEFPIGGYRSIAVASGQSITSKNYRFTPQKWQIKGEWDLILRTYNKTTQEMSCGAIVKRTKL